MEICYRGRFGISNRNKVCLKISRFFVMFLQIVCLQKDYVVSDMRLV